MTIDQGHIIISMLGIVIGILIQLSKKIHHTECEDNFYSCPLHEHYCGEDDKCNCGALKNIEALVR